MLEPTLVDLTQRWIEAEGLDTTWALAKDGSSAFIHLNIASAGTDIGRPHFIVNEHSFRLCCGAGSKESLNPADPEFFVKVKAALKFEFEANERNA